MSSNKTFRELGLNPKVQAAVNELGYEVPSPIQEASIPIILAGKDLIAQAQTGTGKTAAFALPILHRLNLAQTEVQALILVPTRELAIQVAESFKSYARHLANFRVLPIYGGQEFGGQLNALRRGVHVVVGTPGRVMDHLRRGSLLLTAVNMVVLDEADEMLRMGFLEDVKWILQQIPAQHQTALFSATLPASIRTIAQHYLHEPSKVHIKAKAMTATGIEQYVMQVTNNNKLDALTRFLEVEDFDAILIFVRTKNISADLADKIEARGYAAAAMNGDMSQTLREKVIDRLKRKSIDIVVATDVAARGLDVDRISHVINYDAPYDPESYVHRIGRTGRAGRTGKSLLFINPREQYLLRDIEATTHHRIALIEPPSLNQVQKKRMEKFTARISAVLSRGNLDYYREFVEKIAHQCECSELDVAAALVSLAHKEKASPSVGSEEKTAAPKRKMGGKRPFRGKKEFTRAHRRAKRKR